MSDHDRQLDLGKLIGDVYEAALDEQRWRGMAPKIAQTFGSTSTTLQIQRLGTSSHILTMTENVASGIGAYLSHYWQHDIWVERAQKLVGLSRVGSSQDMVTDLEFKECEFYRDWCRHLDVFYVVGAVFPSGPNAIGVLGIHRDRSAGNYSEADKSLVAQFMPHLQRALRVREQLARAQVRCDLSLETLDRCETGVLLVTGKGCIVYANGQAEAMMADGEGIRFRNGRLTAGTRENAERLGAFIRAACAAGNGAHNEGVMRIDRGKRQPLSVLVAPFRRPLIGYPSAGAIVFVRDTYKPISATNALRALYRLTPAEARVAQELTNGQTIEEIAFAHHANPQTVRKQVKSIFTKTGTHRQADCVALILRSIAGIARE